MDAVRYIDEHFEKLKLLHEGKVTVIWLVLDRQDQNACALKIIRRTGLAAAVVATSLVVGGAAGAGGAAHRRPARGAG